MNEYYESYEIAVDDAHLTIDEIVEIAFEAILDADAVLAEAA